jgi:hypothetical protein
MSSSARLEPSEGPDSVPASGRGFDAQPPGEDTPPPSEDDDGDTYSPESRQVPPSAGPDDGADDSDPGDWGDDTDLPEAPDESEEAEWQRRIDRWTVVAPRSATVPSSAAPRMPS